MRWTKPLRGSLLRLTGIQAPQLRGPRIDVSFLTERTRTDDATPLLFADEDQAAKATRDPVAPAHRSEAADTKAATHLTTRGTAVHSFRTLLQDLGSIVRSTCRTRGQEAAPTSAVVTTPTTEQRRALDLLKRIA